jgi:hypothetical protein
MASAKQSTFFSFQSSGLLFDFFKGNNHIQPPQLRSRVYANGPGRRLSRACLGIPVEPSLMKKEEKGKGKGIPAS